MKRNLFLVHTPFQLMNCLNIIEKYYKNEENDIAFLHKNMQQYSSLINKYNSNIQLYYYKSLYNDYKKRNKIIIKLSLVIGLIKGKKSIKKVENRDKIYDSLFVPSEDIGCNITFNYFYTLNNSLELCVYDDGVGTYAKGYLKGSKHFIYEKISNILFGEFFWKKIRKIFCYQPEFIDSTDLDIQKFSIESHEKIEKLFSEKIDDSLIDKYNQSKIIFLDQGNIPFSYENTNIFLELCKRIYKKDEILIKKHPRVKSAYEFDSFETDNSGNPFESIFFNIDIENKILVSMCSTSCLTPYIIKGKSPYVIFLGCLNTDKYNSVFSTSYFQNVITNYRANKIFIPKNIDELKEVLDFMLSKSE